jgi:peptidoglycan/LPS O-acetylase OafA/YrhL
MYLIHFLFLEIINFIYQKTIFYLIHVPELKLLVLMTSVVTVSYYGSRLTYATIEKPAINFGMRFTQ